MQSEESGLLTRLFKSGGHRQRHQPSAGRGRRERKDLRHYLKHTLLQPDVRATTRQGVIHELLQGLAEAGWVRDVEEAAASVLERENSMATGMQHGIAIPHGITSAVDRLVAAIGLMRPGVDFEALDGQLSQICILTLSPEDGSGPPMELMALLGGVLDDDGRAALLDCETTEQMRAVLLGANPADHDRATVVPAAKGRPIIHLRDVLTPALMTPELLATGRDAAIHELLGFAAKAGLLKNPAAAAVAVLERESLMATVLEDGVAMPHARVDGVDRILCMVGISGKGVDFGGVTSHIIVLTLVPLNRPSPYIQFIAAISRALDSAGRAHLLEARTAGAMWSVLTGVEGPAL